MLLTFVPGLIITLLILFGVLMARSEVRQSKQTGMLDGILLLSLYLSIILFGVFLVDSGNTPESINSVASKHMGISTATSETAAEVFLYVSLALVLTTLIVFIIEAITKKSIGAKN